MAGKTLNFSRHLEFRGEFFKGLCLDSISAHSGLGYCGLDYNTSCHTSSVTFCNVYWIWSKFKTNTISHRQRYFGKNGWGLCNWYGQCWQKTVTCRNTGLVFLDTQINCSGLWKTVRLVQWVIHNVVCIWTGVLVRAGRNLNFSVRNCSINQSIISHTGCPAASTKDKSILCCSGSLNQIKHWKN